MTQPFKDYIKKNYGYYPSVNQEIVFDTLLDTDSNVVIKAVAGSGKSTTIKMCIELIDMYFPDKSVIYLCFNSSVAKEMRDKGIACASTLHACGNKAVKMYMPDAKLDNYKVRNILDGFCSRNKYEKEDPKHNAVIQVNMDSEAKTRIVKICDFARIEMSKDLQELVEICDRYGIGIESEAEIELALDVLELCIADKTTYDFTDMLYLPVALGMQMETYDYIFIDESQDLNKVQQQFVNNLKEDGTRFVAVGDPFQAIYGFCGADINSFNKFRDYPNTQILPLSENYRCSQEIISFVDALFPHIGIKAFKGSNGIQINHNASIEELEDRIDTLVLCRNTLPLVALCLEMIKRKKKAFVRGGEIGKSIISLIKKSKAISIEGLMEWLEKESGRLLSRLKASYKRLNMSEVKDLPAYRIFTEKVSVIETIAYSDKLKNTEALIAEINKIFADDKAGICFSSIHKAKGLEADEVYIIDKQLMPSKYASTPDEKKQEENLKYVAYTRARKYLGFIEDWHYYK